MSSAGCAGPDARIEIKPPAERLVAIAVAELELPRGSSDYEAFKRTEDILEVLWSASEWTVLAPGEFRIMRPKGLDDPGALTATDLVVRAEALQLDPKLFGLLSTSVAIRESAGKAHVSKGDDAGVGFHGSSDVVVSLLLRDMHGGRIAEMEVTRPVDPFGERPLYDSRPELRAAVRELVRLMIDRCLTCVSPGKRPPYPLEVSPSRVLAAKNNAGFTLAQALAHAGPLEHDQLLWSNMQYLAPEVSLAASKRHLANPSAACLGIDATAPFLPGDCVITVAGEILIGRHAVARRLARGSTTVEVIGANGARRTLTLP